MARRGRVAGLKRVSLFSADKTFTRFVALGDSYTIGEHVGTSERYPVQTVNLMRAAKMPVLDPWILARTGWTTGDLAAALATSNPPTPADIVTLLIGVNNQYQHKNIDAYRREFADLLKQSIRIAGGKPSHVFVLSIPDWSVTPYGKSQDRPNVAQEIDQFNTVNREETDALHAHYVDITPISRAVDNDRNADLIADDGLHPSGRMYGQWAALLFADIQKELK